MQLDKLSIEVEANTLKAQQAFARMEKSLEAFDQALTKTGKSTSQFQSALTGAAGNLNTFKKGVSGTFTELNSFIDLAGRAKDTIAGVFKAAEDGARINTAASFFNNAGKSIEDFRKATKGLVSDADLIKKSNLADSMGISASGFKNLATVAQAAAAKTGQSYSHMLDSIIVGTARESRLLLDNLGIIINVVQAREEYVQRLRESNQLGELASKTNKEIAESLSDEAEKAAFLEAAMKAGKPMLDEYAKAGDKGAENFDRARASLENFADSLKRQLSSSGAIGAFVKSFTAGTDLLTENMRLGRFLAPKTAQERADQVARLVKSDPTLALNPAGLAKSVFDDDAKQGRQIEQILKDQLFRLADPNNADSLFKKAGVTWEQALEMSGEDVKSFSDLYGVEVGNLIEKFRKLDQQLDNMLRSQLPEKGEKPKLTKEDGSGAGAEKGRGIGFQSGGYGDIEQEFLTRIKRSVADTNFDFNQDEWEAESKKRDQAAAKQEKDRADEERKYWEERMELLVSIEQAEIDRLNRIRDHLDQTLAGLVGTAQGAITGNVSGTVGAVGAGIGLLAGMPQLGAALGDMLGTLLEHVEPLVKIFDYVASGAKEFITRAVGPLFEALSPLADFLFMMFIPVGELIGSILRPFLPMVQLLVAGFQVFWGVLYGVILALSPIVEIFFTLLQTLVMPINLILGLVEIIFQVEDPMAAFVAGVDAFARSVVMSAVHFNNGIVSFIRGLGVHLKELTGSDFELGKFGKYLSPSDMFNPDDGSQEENTDAVRENTKAVRDLAREFRNMPSGYKVNRALYSAQDGAPAPGGGGSTYVSIGSGIATDPRNIVRPGPIAALRGWL